MGEHCALRWVRVSPSPAGPIPAPTMRRIFSLTTLGMAILSATVAAQGIDPDEQFTPCGTSISGHEIAIDANLSIWGHYSFQLFDKDGAPINPLGASSPIVNITEWSDGCDALIDFETHGAPPSPTRRVTRYAGFVGFITLQINYTDFYEPNIIKRYRILYAPDGGRSSSGQCLIGSASSFFCPNTTGSLSDQDFAVTLETDRVRVSTINMWNTGPSYVDETIPDDGWVWPYHVETICSGGRCGTIGAPSNPVTNRMLLMPVDPTGAVPRVGVPFTKRVTGTAPLRMSATAPATGAGVYHWADSWLTLAFDEGGRLEIASSDATVTDMTFTASDPSKGWAGIHYQPGSSGSLTGVTVERVGGGTPSSTEIVASYVPAISVTGASPTFTGTFIEDAVPGSAVHGLVVNGPAVSTIVTATNLTVRTMTGDAVVVNGGARLDLVRGILSNNAGGGITAGPTSVAYLVPGPGADGFRGPRVTQNAGDGVLAVGSAQVRFGAFSNPGDGRAEVFLNSGRGLYAVSGGVLYAGTSTTYQRNSIYQNDLSNPTGNGLASGTGSRVWARCNWWQTTNPANFRVGSTTGGLFDATYYLTGPPNTNPPCINDVIERPGPRTGDAEIADAGGDARGGDETLLDRLVAALGAETPRASVALLAAIVAEAPTSDEAAAALAEAGVLAAQHRGLGPATALLRQATLSDHAALRVAAWQALVGARRADGDRAGALAAAASLALEGDAARIRAETARVYLLGEAGQTTAARQALAALEALAPRSVEASLARAFLGADAPPVASRPAEATPEATRSVAAKRTDDAAVLSVVPNPTPGSTTVTLVLAEAGEATVTVYDLLGRAVATPLSGALSAGAHAATLDGSRQAPGAYVVRAVVHTPSGAVVRTARVTVAR